jgi:ABC-type nitrate/sulfonate/bicarbonate transport system permease component
MSRTGEWQVVLLIQVAVVGFFLLAWQLAAPLGLARPDMLPPFSTVLSYLWRELHDGDFLYDCAVTASEIAVSFALTVPIALILGFVIGENQRLRARCEPVLHIFMAIPKAMFLPLVVSGFGIGFWEKVVFAALLGMFVLIMNGIAAVQSIPHGLIVAVKSMGITKAKLYFEIYLPAMTPLIISSVRVGLIFTIFGVLLAEMYASTRGLGRLIFQAGESFRLTEMLAGVLLVVTASIAVNEALRVYETVATRRRGSF